MKYLLVICLILATPTFGRAAFFWSNSDDSMGIGYLVKNNGTKLYERSDGDAVIGTADKGFPMVSFEQRNEWLGIMAMESVENGRAHVRYMKNAKDAKEGEFVAWVDVKDLESFQFNCCGDNAHCSGFTRPMFRTDRYNDCFMQTVADINQKRDPQAAVAADPERSKLQSDLEKSRLQAELEKTKLQSEVDRSKLQSELEKSRLQQSEQEKSKLQLEVEKLKLELEIQKLKLEQERLKSGAK